jgi:hypothetical protein
VKTAYGHVFSDGNECNRSQEHENGGTGIRVPKRRGRTKVWKNACEHVPYG